LVQHRKKVALTVRYSGFAAFGHPARQNLARKRESLEERVTRAVFVHSPGALRCTGGRPIDAP
jgi:hypothetical protein